MAIKPAKARTVDLDIASPGFFRKLAAGPEWPQGLTGWLGRYFGAATGLSDAL
jgi:hypothetical protein